jgi:hypothetical protein
MMEVHNLMIELLLNNYLILSSKVFNHDAIKASNHWHLIHELCMLSSNMNLLTVLENLKNISWLFLVFNQDAILDSDPQLVASVKSLNMFTPVTTYFVTLNEKPRNPYWRGRLSKVDLLVPTGLDQFISKLKIKFTFISKQATLMRRSTVLTPSLSVSVPWKNFVVFEVKL